MKQGFLHYFHWLQSGIENAFVLFFFLVLNMGFPSLTYGEEPNLFVLGVTDCNGNTMEMSDCKSDRAEKADQWLQAVYASYLRKTEQDEKSVRSEGLGYDGYDPVAKLKKSQALFEEYRSVSADFAYDSAYPGSIRQLRYPATRYYMTIDRVRDLLVSCGYLYSRDEMPISVDLNKRDWCELK